MFICTLSIWLRTQLPLYTITSLHNLVKNTTISVCNHLGTQSGQDCNCLGTQLPWYTTTSVHNQVKYTITLVHNHLGTQPPRYIIWSETFSAQKFFEFNIFFFFFFFDFIFFVFSQFFIRVWPLLTSALPEGKTQKMVKIEVLEHFFTVTTSNIQKIVKNSLRVWFFNKK